MTLHHNLHRTVAPEAGRRKEVWTLTRVTLGSLVVGVLSALGLTMAVFPGATEAVITGSLLCGFGIGWGALAFVSARKARLPQRWARVPAVAMSATGAGLLAFSPNDSSLSVLNWVWPPLTLALVSWMFVQARRALPDAASAAADPGVSHPGRGRRRSPGRRRHLAAGPARPPGSG